MPRRASGSTMSARLAGYGSHSLVGAVTAFKNSVTRPMGPGALFLNDLGSPGGEAGSPAAAPGFHGFGRVGVNLCLGLACSGARRLDVRSTGASLGSVSTLLLGSGAPWTQLRCGAGGSRCRPFSMPVIFGLTCCGALLCRFRMLRRRAWSRLRNLPSVSFVWPMPAIPDDGSPRSHALRRPILPTSNAPAPGLCGAWQFKVGSNR